MGCPSSEKSQSRTTRQLVILIALTLVVGIQSLSFAQPGYHSSMHDKTIGLLPLSGKKTTKRGILSFLRTHPHDSTYRNIEKNSKSKTDKFFQDLAKKANKSYVGKELYGFIIALTPASVQSMDNIVKINPYEQYSSMKIRSIRIKRLKPFGATVYDTLYAPQEWYFDKGNSLHTVTWERVVRNNLTFKEGDTLNPFILEDNERLLRTRNYFRDAKFYIIGTPSEEEVDLLLVTEDFWAISADYTTYGGYNTLKLMHRNALGSGNRLEYLSILQLDKSPPVGHEVALINQSIFNSQVRMRLSASQNYIKDGIHGSIERGFITPETRYAGGYEYEFIEELLNVTIQDSVLELVPIQINTNDVWLGKAFRVKGLTASSKNRYRYDLVTSIRVINERFDTNAFNITLRFKS